MIVIVFETMAAQFLMPVLMERRERPSKAVAALVAEDPDAVIVTGPATGPDADPTQDGGEAVDAKEIRHQGTVINLTQLQYMKSVEHYVELVGQEGRQLIRASLRELAALCPPCQGVMPHRSYWVHRDAIVGINRSEGAQFLVLHDGTEIPVARNRRATVGAWLDRHVGKKRPGR